MKTKKELPQYDFSKPIKLLTFKSPRFDILFYSFLLSALMVSVFYLLCFRDGKFGLDFRLWKVLASMVLIILCYWVKELLDEIRIYPEKLMKKHIWTLKELMEMTGKDEKETKRIMTRVFESCFVVDPKCMLQK